MHELDSLWASVFAHNTDLVMIKTVQSVGTLLFLLFVTSCASSVAVEPTPTSDSLVDTTELPVRATQTSEPPVQPNHTNTSSSIYLDLNPDAPETWASAIDVYLQEGGVHRLKVEMEKLEGAHNWHLDLIDVEVNGNEQVDIALALSALDLDNTVSHSLVLVIECESDSCEIAHQQVYDDAATDPPLLSAQDLDGDGMIDLLVSSRHCGAHTCFLEVEALVWREGGMRNLFTGPTDDLPNPELMLCGPLENGRFLIEITATGIGSAGAGPFRQFTRTWSWSDEQDQFVQAMEVYQDPEYRIHQLHVADELFASDELEAASAAFLKVVQDDDLSDWISGGENISAFAYYRMGLITLLMDGEARTKNPFAQLQGAHPPGTEGSAYSDLAGVFWETFSEGQDWSSACRAAIEFARENSQTIIEPLYYGYANKTYTPEDMCPYGE
jgi:hypothetical protein